VRVTVDQLRKMIREGSHTYTPNYSNRVPPGVVVLDDQNLFQRGSGPTFLVTSSGVRRLSDREEKPFLDCSCGESEEISFVDLMRDVGATHNFWSWDDLEDYIGLDVELEPSVEAWRSDSMSQLPWLRDTIFLFDRRWSSQDSPLLSGALVPIAGVADIFGGYGGGDSVELDIFEGLIRENRNRVPDYSGQIPSGVVVLDDLNLDYGLTGVIYLVTSSGAQTLDDERAKQFRGSVREEEIVDNVRNVGATHNYWDANMLWRLLDLDVQFDSRDVRRLLTRWKNEQIKQGYSWVDDMIFVFRFPGKRFSPILKGALVPLQGIASVFGGYGGTGDVELDIFERLIREAVVRGRRLEGLTTQLSRWVVNQLKRLDVKGWPQIHDVFSGPVRDHVIEFPQNWTAQLDRATGPRNWTRSMEVTSGSSDSRVIHRTFRVGSASLTVMHLLDGSISTSN